jgi:hypothetical protein
MPPALPNDESPVATVTPPDTPLAPPTAVAIEMAPLDVAVPAPDRTKTPPPAPSTADDDPATNDKSPPAAVLPTPTAQTRFPARPLAPRPVDSVIPPELPPVASVAAPVDSTTEPLTPARPASAVNSETVPLDVSVPLPEVIRTSPPDWPPEAPAVVTIEPPCPTVPLPTVMEICPPAPPVALPVVATKAPEAPALDVPVVSNMSPLTPAAPAFAVANEAVPLEVCTEEPEEIDTPPPVDAIIEPARSEIEPPFAVSPCPTLRETVPP